MAEPLHVAIFVTDLDTTRRFYSETLGCTEGRSAETWIDFDFFGHQMSCHLGSPPPADWCGKVDGIAVPMPHFGAILEWSTFDSLAERIRRDDHRFVIEPRMRYEGKAGEQQTMFLLDPSGNALEFKAYRRPAELFAV